MLPGFSSHFECQVSGQNDPLTVLDFEYIAGLSQLYVCEVNFISANAELDYWSFIDKNATLTINVQGAESLQYINGIVTEFVQMGKIVDGYSYQLRIEPHFVQTKHQEKTEVFLNKNIRDIVEYHLKHANIQHYRLDLSQTYQPRAFVCQFQETDFHFICRWLEHEGIYYYFEQGEDFETLVLTDRYSTHKTHTHFSELHFNQDNITYTSQSSYVVENFSSRMTKVAKSLTLKGYNYNDDTKTIVTQTLVSKHGVGDIEFYDENVLDEKDAKRIAEIRAQEINCKEQVYSGRTLALGIVPGCRFKLVNHFRQANNQEYLVYEVVQKGSQRKAALAYLGLNLDDTEANEDEVVFLTDFKAIPGDVQYRAPSHTPIKRIDGIIPAMVDAETSDEYAQLDNQGRYKIRLLHSDKPDGQASDWVRKMESYLGNQYGNHFPLHKDSEICLAFEFGNPDRPIIMGAVHNSSRKNVVTSKNQKTSVSRSAGGNMIIMNDQKGQEYTHFYSPIGDTEIIIGQVSAAKRNPQVKQHKKQKLQQEIDALKAKQKKLAQSQSAFAVSEQAKLQAMQAKLEAEIKGESVEQEEKEHPWPSDWPSAYPEPTDCGSWSYTSKNSASQTMADTFSYTKGNSYSYQIGDANSTVDGTKHYITHGNSNSEVYGNSSSVLMGNSTSTTHGNSDSTTWGNQFSKTMGGSESFTLANALSVTLGASESIVGGLNTSLFLGPMKAAGSFVLLDANYSKAKWTKSFYQGNISQEADLMISSTAGVMNKITGGQNVTIISEGTMAVQAEEGIIINCPTGLTFTCGSSYIKMTPQGVDIGAGPAGLTISDIAVTMGVEENEIAMDSASTTITAPMTQIGG